MTNNGRPGKKVSRSRDEGAAAQSRDRRGPRGLGRGGKGRIDVAGTLTTIGDVQGVVGVSCGRCYK